MLIQGALHIGVQGVTALTVLLDGSWKTLQMLGGEVREPPDRGRRRKLVASRRPSD